MFIEKNQETLGTDCYLPTSGHHFLLALKHYAHQILDPFPNFRSKAMVNKNTYKQILPNHLANRTSFQFGILKKNYLPKQPCLAGNTFVGILDDSIIKSNLGPASKTNKKYDSKIVPPKLFFANIHKHFEAGGLNLTNISKDEQLQRCICFRWYRITSINITFDIILDLLMYCYTG